MQYRGILGTVSVTTVTPYPQNPCIHPPSDFRFHFPKSEVPTASSCALTGTFPSAECPSPISFLLSSPCSCESQASPPQEAFFEGHPPPPSPHLGPIRCPSSPTGDYKVCWVLRNSEALNLWAPFPGVLASPRNEFPLTGGY